LIRLLIRLMAKIEYEIVRRFTYQASSRHAGEEQQAPQTTAPAHRKHHIGVFQQVVLLKFHRLAGNIPPQPYCRGPPSSTHITPL